MELQHPKANQLYLDDSLIIVVLWLQEPRGIEQGAERGACYNLKREARGVSSCQEFLVKPTINNTEQWAELRQQVFSSAVDSLNRLNIFQ